MLKKCDYCGRLFESRDDRIKFCGDACRKESKRRTSRRQSSEWYDITIKNLKIYEVNNILVENEITVEEYMKNREKYVFDY